MVAEVGHCRISFYSTLRTWYNVTRYDLFGRANYVVQSHSLKANSFFSQSGNSLHFIKPEVSSPYSHQPTTRVCPGLERSSPHRRILFPHYTFHVVLPSTLGTFNVSFPSGFLIKTLHAFIFPLYVTHSFPVSFSSIWSPNDIYLGDQI